MGRLTGFLGALALAGAPCHAAPDLVFGPSPRAIDNRAVFDAANAATWKRMAALGVDEIVLNPTFLLTAEIQRSGAPPRPPGTYLSDDDIASLAELVDRTGIAVTYEAGIGLSAERCAAGTPEEIGAEAARTEYARVISRLTKAGISVAALNLDGPFLRLIHDTRKAWSCAASGHGFDAATSARIGRAYMAELVRLVRGGNGGDRPVLRLVVNLPNWQIRDIPRIGNMGAATTDLTDVMHAFAALRDDPPEVTVSEIVIDYPYDLVRQDAAGFRDRVKHLWNMSRGINRNGTGPEFGFIVNSGAFANPCLKDEGRADVPFLPFVRGGQGISGACRDAQTGTDTAENAGDAVFDNDIDYMRDTFVYADALRPGGDLARDLVTADGTAIADHIGHLYYQSWSVNPLSNLWYMQVLNGRLAGDSGIIPEGRTPDRRSAD